MSELDKPRLEVLPRRQPLDVEFVDVDGIRLRVGNRPGSGRPMILLNDIGANLDMMTPLIDALEGFEIIVFDVPGTGGSPALRLPRRYPALARLTARLLDRLGYREAINVVGIGWGGALAQQFALDYPERTNRLILAASSPGMLSMPAGSSIFKRLAIARRYQRRENIDQIVPALYGGLMRKRPELVERRAGRAAGPSTTGYVNQLLANIGWTSAHRLYHLHCPTLVMGGDDDPVMPLVNSRLLYWLIPKSYLHVVRGGGHYFLLIRASESAAVIKRFLRERRYDGTDDRDYYAALNPVLENPSSRPEEQGPSLLDDKPRWSADT